ncbi:LOW QUALITY PROTEIN: F-box only protein 39-like [Chaetodon trifascialis]|uniref:LOW QUALITY PROTEIN: F-box only protein 39-like n=1 Tax=Chaetodon trifascialis TaxID=109706 RepID=UPI003996BF6B
MFANLSWIFDISVLSSVCVKGMQNCMNHGLGLLSALSHAQRRHFPRCFISLLDLRGLFSGAVHVYLNSSAPNAPQGLTHLSRSYSCLSDKLLTAIQQGHSGWRRHSSRDETTLRTFSLHCTLNEPHQQLVSGGCLDLKVKLTVDQVINANWLARILLPEIPLTGYTMTAFYSPDETWSAKPPLRDMLPRFRRSLQYLTLDMSNCSESLDGELLELVKVCECLEQLNVWAFLEVSTVERLLLIDIRLTQGSLLNKIRVRVYTINDDSGEQEDQREEVLSSHLHLPPELQYTLSFTPLLIPEHTQS